MNNFNWSLADQYAYISSVSVIPFYLTTVIPSTNFGLVLLDKENDLQKQNKDSKI